MSYVEASGNYGSGEAERIIPKDKWWTALKKKKNIYEKMKKQYWLKKKQDVEWYIQNDSIYLNINL